MKSRLQSYLGILLTIGFWPLNLAAVPLVLIGWFINAASVSDDSHLSFYGTVMLGTGLGILLMSLGFAIFQWRTKHNRYSAAKIAIISLLLAVLASPLLLRKRTVPLMSGGRTIAIARRPIVWGDVDCPVYSGNTRLFSLWADAFDAPWFIYPFADGHRFLCIDDDDTSVLVFVVDRSITDTNAPVSFGWPPNDYARNYIARRAPEVVTVSLGSVRLPKLDEVNEVAAYIKSLTPSQLKKVSFPTMDLGYYRYYLPDSVLLKELDPNRTSVWP
jgi:hypothetical protein